MQTSKDNVVPFPNRGSEPLDLGQMFDLHAPYLLRVAHRLTGRRDLAEDLVQEVFLVAWRRREELVDPDGMRTWLYRVTVNVVRHRRRSEGRYGGMLDRFKAVFAPRQRGPDSHLEAKHAGERVHATIAMLSPKQREVFVLFELEELDGAEIAAILDIPVNTVWSRLRLARAAFKKHWGDDEL